MKILTTASIVTSIIAELPLTVSGGIGKDIYNSFNNQITTRVWASLVMLCTVSILFFKSMLEIEKTIINKYRYAKE
jgi:ABC-type nitrate/sulfonate/bicarbonate transport system permease component